MLSYAAAHVDAPEGAEPRPSPLRLSSLSIRPGAHSNDQTTLFQILEPLLVDGKAASSLVEVRVFTKKRRGKRIHESSFPIVSRLFQTFPWLLTTLRVLHIIGNKWDEAADIGALAACSRLEWLSLQGCGTSAIRGLQGGCLSLRRLDLSCCRALTSLEGLEEHVQLQELNVTGTQIASLHPLRLCRSLSNINLNWCRQLTTLDGLEDLRYLQEVDFSWTAIPSLAPVRACRAFLKKVELSNCDALTSLVGLEQHAALEDVSAPFTPITSLLPLQHCRLLKYLSVLGCRQLTALDGLEHHQHLEEVQASQTAITSVRLLLTCPALRKVHLIGCEGLTSLDGLEERENVEVFLTSGLTRLRFLLRGQLNTALASPPALYVAAVLGSIRSRFPQWR